MIHIYTGNGKGKTTSAFGLAIRASGQGLKVAIFQFLKPKSLITGEEITVRKIKNINLMKYEEIHPMFMGKKAGPGTKEKIKKCVGKTMADVKKAIFSGKYNMIVLDEVINALDQGFAEKKDFLKLIKGIPGDIELVLTGRGGISSMEKFADYITIMIEKKHPFRRKIAARKGIEY